MSKRERIVEATKALLWEKGFEATSPKDIQVRSNAGQGSLYHHFPSKHALAREVIGEIVRDRIDDFEVAMNGAGPLSERLLAFVEKNQKHMWGCRVGRLVWDSAIGDEELRAPLSRYFTHLEQRLIEILEAEQAAGKVAAVLPPPQLALIVIATIQGSFAMSRAMNRSRAADTGLALRRLLDVTHP